MKRFLILLAIFGLINPVYANDPSKALHICAKWNWELSSEQALKQLGLKTKKYDGTKVDARSRVAYYCDRIFN